MAVVYRNIGSSAKWFPLCKGGTVPAGGYVVAETYVYPLDPDFQVVTHSDAPLDKLHAAAIGAGITKTGLAKYGQILLANTSGGTITVTINEDSTNVLTITNGTTYPITNNKDVEKIVITGSGTDPMYVWGLDFQS